MRLDLEIDIPLLPIRQLPHDVIIPGLMFGAHSPDPNMIEPVEDHGFLDRKFSTHVKVAGLRDHL